jgi:hypothetical protein
MLVSTYSRKGFSVVCILQTAYAALEQALRGWAGGDSLSIRQKLYVFAMASDSRRLVCEPILWSELSARVHRRLVAHMFTPHGKQLASILAPHVERHVKLATNHHYDHPVCFPVVCTSVLGRNAITVMLARVHAVTAIRALKASHQCPRPAPAAAPLQDFLQEVLADQSAGDFPSQVRLIMDLVPPERSVGEVVAESRLDQFLP